MFRCSWYLGSWSNAHSGTQPLSWGQEATREQNIPHNWRTSQSLDYWHTYLGASLRRQETYSRMRMEKKISIIHPVNCSVLHDRSLRKPRAIPWQASLIRWFLLLVSSEWWDMPYALLKIYSAFSLVLLAEKVYRFPTFFCFSHSSDIFLLS